MAKRFIYTETRVEEIEAILDKLKFGKKKKEEEGGDLVRRLEHFGVIAREITPGLDQGFGENSKSRVYCEDLHFNLLKEEVYDFCIWGKALYGRIREKLKNPIVYNERSERVDF